MVWLKKQITTYWPYLLVTLGVLGPLLVPGYVLTMDMVFVPHPPIPGEVNASFPFYVALHYLSYVIPGDVLQKMVLFMILLLAGVGMHRLLVSLPGVTLSRLVVIAASLFYMLNPFVYERLMMGQFAVVAGYALLPFVVLALWRFLQEPTWRNTWRFVALILALSIVSIHTLIPMAIIGLLFVTAEQRRWRAFSMRLIVGLLVVAGVSSYWVIPTIAGGNTMAAALTGEGSQAFATEGGLFSLLRLQGFWAEHRGLFIMPQQLTPLPGVWQTLIWIALLAGFVRAWRRWRSAAVIYGSMIVVGCIVALTGIGDGYREPHKIMALAALGMSVLVAIGADAWRERGDLKRPSFALVKGVVICLTPILLGLGMFWGFSGQLSARAYPSEWYALSERMKSLPDDKPAIFVPWHLYQRYSFSPRVVANPAATFFEGRKVIVSNDPEFSGVKPLRNDALTDSVGRILANKPRDIANKLSELGVGYVIIAREPGYEDYEFLRSTEGLQNIFNEGRIAIYEVEVSP